MEWAEHRTFLLIGEFDVTTSLYVQIPLFKKKTIKISLLFILCI